MAKRSAKDYFDRLSPATLDLVTAATEADFDQAFDNWLTRAIHHLETNKQNYRVLGEEGLSAVLAAALSTPEISVTQEQNSNGHVDLTVTLVIPPFRIKLGEAKIWDGSKYHVKGLNQLISRYTTGRECRGFVISYVRLKDITGLFADLRQYINDEKSCDLHGLCADHNIRWSFLSTHKLK